MNQSIIMAKHISDDNANTLRSVCFSTDSGGFTGIPDIRRKMYLATRYVIAAIIKADPRTKMGESEMNTSASAIYIRHIYTDRIILDDLFIDLL